MRAIANAQASVDGVDADRQLMEAALSTSTGIKADHRATLGEIATSLDQATKDISAAVSDLATGDRMGSASERKQSVQQARARLTSADTAKAAAARKLMDLQQRGGGGPAAGAVLNAANAMLTGIAKASSNARVAAKRSDQMAKRISGQQGQAIVIVAVAIVSLVAWYLFTKPEEGLVKSGAFAWIIVTATLLFVASRDAENGVFGPIIGGDKRFSTSKTQAAIWTIAFGFAASFLVGRALWAGDSIDRLLPQERLGEYLLLLGGPFAAGVLAKMTVSWKLDNGSLQKTDAAEATAGQLLQDDAGNVDLVDSQYLMFNLIALGYFIIKFAQTAELPDMPDVLLGLTSASALTYTTNKAVERNAPQITSVSPRSCLSGQRLSVAGQNFYAGVDDPSTARVAVLIEGYAGELSPIPGSSTTTELSVDLPPTLAAGTKGLTVRTEAKVTSAPYLIDVLDDAPVIFGLRSKAIAGAEATAVGRNLLSPGATGSEEDVAVTIGGFAAVGHATDKEVTFTIPEFLPADTDAALTVTRADSTSAPITVHTSP